MLAKSRAGYYRGEQCPITGEQGRFLMKDHEIDRIGRMMALILRHQPEKFGLNMDGRGWVDLNGFVDAIRNSRDTYRRWLRDEHIIALVETDDKGRYQIDGGMIRATYAHSVNVNLDDLPECHLDQLYYPVSEEEVDLVLEAGLRPQDRNMIHLSGTAEKAFSAGRVHMQDPILLEIDVKASSNAGNFIFRAGRDVYVTESVEHAHLKKYADEDQVAVFREKYKDQVPPAELRARERAERDAQREAREKESTGSDGPAPKPEPSDDDEQN